MARRRLFNTSDINQITRNLRRRGLAMQEAAKGALLDGVKEIVSTAKSLAPVDTGKLQASIHYEQDPADNGLVYKIVADAKNEKGVPYGKFVEFDPRINQPFLYPAIESCKRRISENLKQATRRELH